MTKDTNNTRFTVFIENTRILAEHEISQLPEEKRNAVKGKQGIWVEVDCPEGACSVEKDQITLPVGSTTSKDTKGVWLRLFCPDNQCSIEESTDLP
jgi:hypothetical protein